MKISLEWIKDYVDIDRTAEELGDILSDRGFPIEEIIRLGDDTVLDVEVTSNRGDCLSHIGIAREIAAATSRELKIPQVKLDYSDKSPEDFVSVDIENAKLCPRYTVRIIEGVKVGPTPEWMKKRIEAVGIRSVNNVVDATNYAMYEMGQPSHAFDYDKVQGGKIIVRSSRAGEKLVSIDGTDCKLKKDYLVIADEQRPVAIAGVMGGLETEISSETTTVLLEVASFDPLTVRMAARALTLNSDASFRFERNIDIQAIESASARTAELIAAVAGGKVVKTMVDVYPAKCEKPKVSMALEKMKALLGMDIDTDEVMKILTSLGFVPVKEGEVINCSVPSWRNDISREVDLIEEVIRSYGYDKISTEKKINIAVAKIDPAGRFRAKVNSYLQAAGFYETVNITFIDKQQAGVFGLDKGQNHMAVKDVSRKNANILRNSLISSLMGVFRANYNVGNHKCRIYEMAHTFVRAENGQPDEKMKIAMLCEGDFRLLKGVVEGLIKMVNKNIEVQFTDKNYSWSSVGADISIEGKTIGCIGTVSKQACSKMDLKAAEPVVAEIDFNTLMSLQGGIDEIKAIPRFPAIVRDLSIIVADNVRWKQIKETVEQVNCSLLEEISFVDIYTGKPIDKGCKSITLSLRFRDDDGTLRHEAVDEFETAIVDKLQSQLKAELRK